MSAPPLAALCVSDVSQKCVGKTGLRKEICENLWGFEASHCPNVARAVHQHCVDYVQNLEKNADVCRWGEIVLAPGVAQIASRIKDPALNAEFAQNWPSWCKGLQDKFSQNMGGGEQMCTEIENEIVKLVSKRV